MLILSSAVLIAASLHSSEAPEVKVEDSLQSRILECKLVLDEEYEKRNEVYQGSTLSFCTIITQ